MTTLDTLKLIAARSPDALHEALGAIRAQQTGSSMAARRAERTAAIALRDPAAQWTAEERVALSDLLGTSSNDGGRTFDLRLRVTAAEKEQVQAAAEAEGQTVSEYIRSRIGL